MSHYLNSNRNMQGVLSRASVLGSSSSAKYTQLRQEVCSIKYGLLLLALCRNICRRRITQLNAIVNVEMKRQKSTGNRRWNDKQSKQK